MHTGGDEGMCSGIVSHISGGTAESSIGYTGSVTKHQIDASHSHTVTTNTSSTGTSGNGRAFDVTPACIAAYCWKRTA